MRRRVSLKMKILSLVLTFCLILSVLPTGLFSITVRAATYDVLTYTIVNNEVAITRCDTFATGSVHIPSELEGYPVTRIYGSAFLNCTKVRYVYIPSTVTKIETGAFSYISNLEGIYVDEGNQNYCDDNGVLFNKDKTSLLQAHRTLTEYVVPNSVTHIGDSAFNYCKNLSNVTIGDKVTSIGSSAFEECTSLVSIKIPDSVKTIGGSAFYSCGNLSSVVFGNSITEIGDYAFNYCDSLTTVSLPDSVIDINRAFNQCGNLTNIDIGNGVKTLEYRALWGCDKLSSITIGSTLSLVYSDAFEGCESLINVYYRGTAAQWEKISIGDGNFYLTERATVHYIHDCQWDEGAVTKEPSCVPGIVTYTCTWPGCGETMTESIEKISDHTYGSWTSVDGENHQRTCDCGDIEIRGHNWDKAICTDVRTCTICGQKSQGHIWAEATCTAPKTCTICNSTEGSPVHTVVGDICSKCQRYGTCGNNLIWLLDDAGVLTISGIGEMSDYDYNTIPWYAFKDAVKSLVLDYGVTSVGECAFYECYELRNVSLSATVSSIGENAFYFCNRLTAINIPNGVTTIDKYAFRGCSSITSIKLPDSVSTIGSYAFSYCLGLESINVPDAVTIINQSIFRDSKNLKYVTIGKGVTKIMSSAFGECSSIESINIPTTVTSIQSTAFEGCDKLSTVIYCGTATQWESIQFINNNKPLLNCQRIQHAWVDATCTTPKTCIFCDEIEGDVTYEHNWDEGTITTVPTCTKDGVRTFECKDCDVTKTEAEPRCGHDYVLRGDLVNTHPHTKTYICSNCGDIITEDEKLNSCLLCNFTFTALDVSSYKVVSYTGTGSTVIVPGKYNNCTVTTIANGCFKGNTNITSVEIGSGVTTIGSLAFMNCTALEKVIIPASVTSIGANAFYGFTGTIYCFNGSTAHQYAIDNNIPYVLMSFSGKGTTKVDYVDFLVRTSIQCCDDLTELFEMSDSILAVPMASYVYGNLELYGTGTVITVFDGDTYVGDFTLIVEGDTNGDSVCDVLDCAEMALVTNGLATLDGAYAEAGDSNDDDIIDVNDYSAIVNTALAS